MTTRSAMALAAVLVAGLGLALAPLVTAGALLAAAALVSTVIRPVGAVVVFVLALPLGLRSLNAGPIDLVQVLAVLVVAAVVLRRLADGRTPLSWHPSAAWAVALVLCAVIATVTALDVPVAVNQTVALAVAALLALAVYTACRRPDDLRLVVLLLAAVGAGVCLHSLGDAGSIASQGPGAGAVDNRAVGVFRQPNELGTFSAMLLFVGAGLATGARRSLERVVGRLCAVTAGLALVVSLSRGAWIGSVLGLLVLAWLSRRARRALAVVLLVLGLAGPLVLSSVAPHLWEVVQGRVLAIAEPGSNPEDARGLIYREARRQIAERPLTGWGPGNYLPVSQTDEGGGTGINALHAHNVLLNVAAEAGVPAAAALVLFTVSVGVAVLAVRPALDDADQALVAGLAAALVALAGQGLVDFTFRNPTLLFLSWTVVGLVLAATSPAPREQVAVSGPAEASATE